MTSKYIIGIDLHGTLLDKQWEIKTEVRRELITNLQQVKGFCKVYVCSGNDLTFIKKYLPGELRVCFDGYVLETGCVISDGIDEKIIIPEHMIRVIKNLEGLLKASELKDIKYFARRLTTISMFTRDARGGTEPDVVYPAIQELVTDLGYHERVLVTHSNVAVDIIPKGHNKFSGLEHNSDGLQTIGIAESLNDYPMILHADYSFIPANSSPKLIGLLKDNGKKIVQIEDADITEPYPRDTVLMSRYNSTKGVIDILKFISDNLE